VLDVFRAEPLPPESPLWSHPKVVVTPHEAGGMPQGSLAHVAENYRRLRDGQSLINTPILREGIECRATI
jgi:glyoxylate/hydroxypyruvate reductase A